MLLWMVPIANGRGVFVELLATLQFQLNRMFLLALLCSFLAVVGRQVDHLGLVDLQLIRKLLREDLVMPIAQIRKHLFSLSNIL